MQMAIAYAPLTQKTLERNRLQCKRKNMELVLSPANGLSSWFSLHHRKKDRELRERMREMNIPQLTDPMHACLFGSLGAGKNSCIKHLDSFFVTTRSIMTETYTLLYKALVLMMSSWRMLSVYRTHVPKTLWLKLV